MSTNSTYLYINTQSANVVQSANEFSNFKVNFSGNTITRSDTQDLRLSVEQFNCPRLFNLCNKTNNTFRVTTIGSSAVNDNKNVEIPQGDYTSLNALNLAFLNAVMDEIISQRSISGIKPIPAISDITTSSEAVNDVNGLGRDTALTTAAIQRKVSGTIEFAAAHGLTDPINESCCIQTVCRRDSTVPLSDSYALIGGLKVESDETPNTNDTIGMTQSFTLTRVSATKLKVEGIFPMRLQTNDYMYLKCLNAQNLESPSLSQGTHDNQMLSSAIVQKILVDYLYLRVDNGNNFVGTLMNVNLLQSLQFHITDHKDRDITVLGGFDDPNIARFGGLYIDMVCRIDLITVPRYFPSIEFAERPDPLASRVPGLNYAPLKSSITYKREVSDVPR